MRGLVLGGLFFLAGLWNHPPRCRLFCRDGAFRKNRADLRELLSDLVASSSRWDLLHIRRRCLVKFASGTVLDGGDQMRNAEHIYSIADQHSQTVQVYVDRLQELGATEQLKRLSGRLQKLADRATPGDDKIGTKAAQRQRERRRKRPPEGKGGL